jgi:hypothetical protein
VGDLKENKDTFFVSLFSGACMRSIIFFIIYMRGNAYNAHYRRLGNVWAVFLRASELLCVLAYGSGHDE